MGKRPAILDNGIVLEGPSVFSAGAGYLPTWNADGTFAGWVSQASLQTTDASLLTSGTLADARLSGNVAMRNAANAFTQPQTADRWNVGTHGAAFSASNNLDLAYNAYHDGTTWRTRAASAAASMIELQEPGSNNVSFYSGVAAAGGDQPITWTLLAGLVNSGGVSARFPGSMAVGSSTYPTSEQLAITAASGRVGLRVNQVSGQAGQIIKVAGTSNPFEVHPAASSTPFHYLAASGAAQWTGTGSAVNNVFNLTPAPSGSGTIGFTYGAGGATFSAATNSVWAFNNVGSFTISTPTATSKLVFGEESTSPKLKIVPHASQSADNFQVRNSGDTATLAAITSVGEGRFTGLDLGPNALKLGSAIGTAVGQFKYVASTAGSVSLRNSGDTAFAPFSAGNFYAFPAAEEDVFTARTPGDLYNRFAVTRNGVVSRGIGTSAADLREYRGAANRLDIDGGSGVAGALRVLGATTTNYAELTGNGPGGSIGLSINGDAGVRRNAASQLYVFGASGGAGSIIAAGGLLLGGSNGLIASDNGSGLKFLGTGSGVQASTSGAYFRGHGTGTDVGWAAYRSDNTTPAYLRMRRAVYSDLTTGTPTNQIQAELTPAWVDAADATRKGRAVFSVYDATASREAWRAESSGSAPMIGFLGAAAVARQTVGAAATGGATIDAEARTSLAAIRTALINLGLCAA